ncbi:hypothetical protein [Alkalihalobacterium chitinilyticum]|uniref:Uncharacterized protein n=1 Tax=Alkalihalobacterium chitinilyticum TaxID=2980103 RepID=A0ABT5VL26_9BACI|nr:hypothetical protein [Alkalihalobacterium chitinilyticum]MDE5416153.1 hypothetical protein [Alkalihalobacterium chitinilyticum]
MEKIFVKTCNWLGFILLLFSLSSALLDITVFDSNYIVFYGISVFGLMIGSIGWLQLRSNSLKSVTKMIGRIGFFGNLAIVILYFLPFYFFWGTYIFGP